MPYNPKTQQSVLISKDHHAQLKLLAVHHKRTLSGQLEYLIQKALLELQLGNQ